MSRAGAAPQETAAVNEIHLVGEVRGIPELKVLPSGDEIVALRVAVRRSDRDRRTARSPRSDLFDVTCFTSVTRRTALSLNEDDVVEIHGAMRRSVRRGAQGMTSRMDVEVRTLSRRSPRRKAG